MDTNGAQPERLSRQRLYAHKIAARSVSIIWQIDVLVGTGLKRAVRSRQVISQTNTGG
jgi:hypothetical protein